MFFRRVRVPAGPLSSTLPAKAEEPLARWTAVGSRHTAQCVVRVTQIINAQICKASVKRRCGQFETAF